MMGQDGATRSGQGSGASVLTFPPEVRLRLWSARPQ